MNKERIIIKILGVKLFRVCGVSADQHTTLTAEVTNTLD